MNGSESNPPRRRILIVEDRAVLALATQGILEILGYEVVGPAGRLEEGIALATDADIDAAVLDVGLVEGESTPIAEILEARGIPFLFMTGYEDAEPTKRWEHAPVLTKPIVKRAFELALQELLGPRTRAG